MITGIDDNVSRLVNLLKATNENIKSKRGSVVHDGFILPAAASASWDASLNVFTQGIQALDNILLLKTNYDFQISVAEALGISVTAVLGLLTTAIERYASNFNLQRKQEEKAFGIVYFYTSDAPTEDLIVPSGTTIENAQGIQYITTNTAVLLKDSVASYYDPALRAYSVAVSIEAVLPGVESNVSANQLVYAVGTLPTGFVGVDNKYAIDNGHDVETDETLVDRVKTTLRGLSTQTSNGIKALVLNNTTARSIFIADAQSPLQIRNNGKGGVVDIYTIDTLPTQIEEEHTNVVEQVLAKQPVIDIISVTGPFDGDPDHVFIEGDDYTLVKDSNILSKNSIKALDKIVWSGDVPTGAYKVDYAFNQMLHTIQDLVTSDDNKPLMGDISSAVLTREGTKVLVEISYPILVYGTYSKDVVIRQATTNVQAMVNRLGFGESLYQSDIIQALENTEGVQSVTTVADRFNRVGIVGTADPITVSSYEYIRAGTIVIY